MEPGRAGVAEIESLPVPRPRIIFDIRPPFARLTADSEPSMYTTLFDLAGYAIYAWLLLILLPKWRLTRWIAETAIFPIYLAVIYAVGIGLTIAETGFVFMGDFGSAEGVRNLLSQETGAMIAWIHILAFDQVVALLIYRDNMRRRFVPLPLQSLILVATLMLGPIGFLTYVVIRMARQTGSRVAWGESERSRDSVDVSAGEKRAEPVVVAPRFSTLVGGLAPLPALRALLSQNRALAVTGALGLGLAAATALRAAINGGWMLGQEGRLLEAAKFDTAVGIFILTLALIVPFAPWTNSKRRQWVGWMTAFLVYSYAIETVQAWRGVDPRFSAIFTEVERILGLLFFAVALGVMVLFIDLMRSFFRDDAVPDHPGLRLAFRYAAGGAMTAFGVGIAMSLIYSGREVGTGGDLMLIHAAGFHGLQAVPLVALLVGTELLPEAEVRRIVHLAGIGWMALCAGLTLQALAGLPALTPSLMLGLSIGGLLTWAVSLALAVRARYAARPALA